MWIDLLVFTNGAEYNVMEMPEIEDKAVDNMKATEREKHIVNDKESDLQKKTPVDLLPLEHLQRQGSVESRLGQFN